jgi:putative ABC transport system permease protein
MLGISLAVGAAVMLLALANGIESTSEEALDERGADLSIMQRGASDILSGFLPAGMEARLAAIPGVSGVAGELALFMLAENDRHILTVGWPDTSYFWKAVPLEAGRIPHPQERGVVVLGDAAAEALMKRVGDEVEFLGTRFRVIGIARFASLINRGLAIVPLSDLQAISFRGDQVTLFYIRLARPLVGNEIERMKRQISEIGGVTVEVTAEMLREDRNLKVLNAITVAISVIALMMGALNVLNTLLATIQERTREIGIMAALGWPADRIMRLIVIEGLLLCVPGCVIGVLLAYLASLVFAAIPVIGAYLTMRVDLALAIPVVVAAIALCALGSLYPAWRVTRMSPAEALQRA